MTDEIEHDGGLSRRRILAAGLGVSFGVGGVSLLSVVAGLVPRAARTPANEPPRKGDLLVFAMGSNTGQTITPDDVPVGGPQVLAWPMDPLNRVVRNDNHLNILLLVRADERGWFSAEEEKYTVANVAAYSATCTHLCCSVSDWVAKAVALDPHGYLFCPCHKSHYDPWDGARVIAGPAPRPLPILPLTLDGTRLAAAQSFLTPPGCSVG